MIASVAMMRDDPEGSAAPDRVVGTYNRAEFKLPYSPSPFNPHDEATAIGCLLLQPALVDHAVARGLTPVAFWDPFCRAAFDAIVMLHTLGEPVEAIIVASTMRGTFGWCDRCADLEVRLADCAALPLAAVEIELDYHARMVVHEARRRRFWLAVRR